MMVKLIPTMIDERYLAGSLGGGSRSVNSFRQRISFGHSVWSQWTVALSPTVVSIDERPGELGR
jgi:hypothetical protein